MLILKGKISIVIKMADTSQEGENCLEQERGTIVFIVLIFVYILIMFKSSLLKLLKNTVKKERTNYQC